MSDIDFSTPPEPFPPGASGLTQAVARLQAHLRIPLFLNAYALMVNVGLTSVLGILYWIVAARVYTAQEVGQASAAISTMMLVSGIAQLNMAGALTRFLPSAGRSRRRYVLLAYKASIASSFVAAVVFFIVFYSGSTIEKMIGSSDIWKLWFTISIVTWSIFALQDFVLAALRAATWIAVENAVFGVVKIGLLVALAPVSKRFGIFGSWTIPVVVGVVVVNWLIFTRLLTRRNQFLGMRTIHNVPVSQLGRFVAVDYLGALFSLAIRTLLPILVATRLGATQAGLFYVAWIMAVSLELVTAGLGTSLTVEGAIDETRLAEYVRAVMKRTAIILVPVVLVMVVFAGPILSLFGPAYAHNATTVLQLLALAALPRAVTSFQASIARVQRHIARATIAQGVMCALVLGLSAILIDSHGLTGVGIAYLVSQVIVALALAPLVLRAATGRGHRDRESVAVREILDNCGYVAWGIKTKHTGAGKIVSEVGPPGRSPTAVVKLGATSDTAATVDREARALRAIEQRDGLETFRPLVPAVLADGSVDGYRYLVESAIPGVDGQGILVDETMTERLLFAAVDAIGHLHRGTEKLRVVHDQLLTTWVDERIVVLNELGADPVKVHRLQTELRDQLTGRTLKTAWIHGDYWPGNVRVTIDGDDIHVTGIIDWERMGRRELPLHDLLHLIMYTRRIVERRELGSQVCDVLNGSGLQLSPRLVSESLLVSDDRAGERTTVLLYWLRHISSNLVQSPAYANDRRWIRTNVTNVVNAL